MTVAPEQMLDLLGRSVTTTGRILAGIPEDEWEGATPCEDMTVLALARHIVAGLTQFADVGAGRPYDIEHEPEFPPDQAAERYEQAGAEMISVWSRSGAAERTYPMPWGDTTGTDLAGFMVIEQVTHGWDLARATGQEAGYDADLVEAALALARGYDNPGIRVPPMFGPVVAIAADAAPIDRLAAFLGRRPDLL